VGKPQLGAVPRSYQATPVGPDRALGRKTGPSHELAHRVVERAKSTVTSIAADLPRITLSRVVYDPVIVTVSLLM